MVASINASTSAGVVTTADTSGVLALQTAGTTAVTLDTNQRAAFVAGTAALPAITTTGDTNTGIFFPAADTIAFSEGGSESMRIDSSGNVGIGNTTPSSYNAVADNLVIGTSGSNGLTIVAGTTNDGSIHFADGTSGADADRGQIYYSHAGNYMVFGTDATERMRINSSGSLLVGTTSSGSGATAGLFRVSKTSGNGIYSEAATTAAGYRYISNALSDGGTYYHFNFTEGGTQRGSITSNGSNTSYTTSSDYRLKENIQPLTGALSLVSRLKPSAFRWKETGTEDSGFIAHELQEVCPSAVTGEKDAVDADGNPKYQSVDTSFLVATLTAAIQETKALIDTQAETINALTARIVALETA